MSADNGIYVLGTPLQIEVGDEVKAIEYRVIEAQAIDNIYYYEPGPLRNAELVRYFGKAKVCVDRTKALLKAHEMGEMCEILEYGVRIIYWPEPFPNMTMEQAEKILKEEHNRVFEEEQPGHWKKRENVGQYLYVNEKR